VVSFTLWPLHHRGNSHGTNWIGGWVGPRTGSGRRGEEKILPPPELELRPSSPWSVAIPAPLYIYFHTVFSAGTWRSLILHELMAADRYSSKERWERVHMSCSAVPDPEDPTELTIPNNTHVFESVFSSGTKYDTLHSQEGLHEMWFSHRRKFISYVFWMTSCSLEVEDHMPSSTLKSPHQTKWRHTHNINITESFAIRRT
jgi:hypothetical protein